MGGMVTKVTKLCTNHSKTATALFNNDQFLPAND